MADFLFKMNIAHHEKLLTGETDSKKIVMLHRLVAEEAKFARWRTDNPQSNTPQSNAAE